MSMDNNKKQIINPECISKKGVLESYGFDFSDTSFDLLMQTRIHRVLLVCSNYDAFMLEEDGRIDEQIFIEYVSLNLRYPPVFVQVDSAEEAFQRLEDENIDLVITMWGKGDMDAFELSRQIKRVHKNIPIVVLTYFSREVSELIDKEDLSAIDYIFCWLGNANLLLAIIKLIEDKMNAEHDIIEIGVQTIILFNNQIYGLTKGQYSPTSYKGFVNKTSPYGTVEEPFHPGELVIGAQGKFFARTIDSNVKLSTEIYIEAGKYKGTSVVEVLQNCIIFNDKVYSYLTDKEEKENRQIILHHNEPMIFGKDNDKGIILKDNKLTVVKIGENGITKADLLVHNSKEINPGIHLMLTNMRYPDYPVAFGIIRSVDAITYDYDVNHQMEEIRAKADIKCVDDLLNSGNTWEL